MELGLRGKRVLVIGSSSGLGEETARFLAQEGAIVVIHGRNEARAAGVAASINASGGVAGVAIGDLATDVGADSVFAAVSEGDPIDVLVNNAGGYDHLSWSAATPERWAAIYNANVISGVRMINRFVPGMRERGWGRVVTIGGGLAIQPEAAQPHYNATLAARHNLATSLARELKDTGVTSNVVSPGPVLLDSFKDMLTASANQQGATGNWGRDRAPGDPQADTQ